MLYKLIYASLPYDPLFHFRHNDRDRTEKVGHRLMVSIYRYRLKVIPASIASCPVYACAQNNDMPLNYDNDVIIFTHGLVCSLKGGK